MTLNADFDCDLSANYVRSYWLGIVSYELSVNPGAQT
jgi:hypothetical protein